MVHVKCQMCKKVQELNVTEKQLKQWKSGALIQEVMPHLTPGERELLITGTCETCFDKLFRGDE